MRKKSTTPYETQKKIFFMLLGILVLLFSAYIYFVSASIVHVIVRKEIDRDIVAQKSNISDLEAAFIVAKQSITEETIAKHGFSLDTPEKIYIKKVPTSLVLVSER